MEMPLDNKTNKQKKKKSHIIQMEFCELHINKQKILTKCIK